MSKKARVIVITGATRGLGRALVEAFAASEHTVIGCGRSAAGIEALRQQFAAPHTFSVVDVVARHAVHEWADAVLREHGPPDLLINNAAVINDPVKFWEVPATQFDDVIDINVKGVANVMRAFLPAMVKRRSGVIVNLSSGWGRSTSPEVAAYCASKFAIEGLTRALAEELPAGMAAIPLNPGVIHTDMLRQCFGTSAASYPSPNQWAEKAAPFLLDLGPRQNGQSLTVPS